ncbi:hypothetical protein GCM10009612_70380 [Streptomyces beijiangensis]
MWWGSSRARVALAAPGAKAGGAAEAPGRKEDGPPSSVATTARAVAAQAAAQNLRLLTDYLARSGDSNGAFVNMRVAATPVK